MPPGHHRYRANQTFTNSSAPSLPLRFVSLMLLTLVYIQTIYAFHDSSSQETSSWLSHLPSKKHKHAHVKLGPNSDPLEPHCLRLANHKKEQKKGN